MSPAIAFPPYHTTDADTADPHTLELRFGMQAARDSGSTETLAPRMRANFGLPHRIEIVSEFDFLPHSGIFDDGAAGIKWVPIYSDEIGIGTEALALLPVRPMDRGLGTETQLIATFKSGKTLLHLNVGGLYDPRGAVTESGWRASGLLEVPTDSFRLGLEAFAKETNLHAADVRVGVGLIYAAGRFDIRLGAHAGLTPSAPDVTVNLWMSRTFSFP